jgi:hypothetical protein
MNWKIEQLEKMIEAETRPDGGYGAHLKHWASTGKPINLDAKALQALIDHYKSREGRRPHETDMESAARI